MSAHGGGNRDRWLVSYADFITLLFVLFVVLYSMGQVDVQKYKALAESMRAAFSGGPWKVVDPAINQAGGMNKDAEPAPIIVEGMPLNSPVGVEVAGKLRNLLMNSNLSSEVSIQNNVEGVLISLSEKLLFVPGTAELHPDVYLVLDTIVDMLSKVDNEVRVVGHTDDTPPTDPRYSNNWELSLARAYTIVDYLSARGIDPKRLIPSGRADTKPIFPNDTPEHRAYNGRAEIMVIYNVGIDVINLNLADMSQAESLSQIAEGN